MPVLLAIGVPLHNDQFTCPECHGVADSLGDHQVECGGNSDRISRHNAILDVVLTLLSLLLWAPQKKLQGWFQTQLLARPTSSFPIGPTAARLLLTSTLFLPSNPLHCLKLHGPRATLSKCVSNV